MISETAVYGTSSAVYVLTALVVIAWMRRLPDRFHRYCYAVLLVVGTSGVTSALTAAGIGTIPLGADVLDVPNLLSGVVAYPVVWGLSAVLAGVSGRTLALVLVIPFTQRVAFEVAALHPGALGLVAALVVIGGHLVLGYLFAGRIWEQAQSVPDSQRLLHWKMRNLLLFLIGMIIVFAFLSTGGIFDAFVAAVVIAYIDILIRVGTTGFLLANVTGIDVSRTSDVVGGGDAVRETASHPESDLQREASVEE